MAKTAKSQGTEWLEKAVFYQIYPQSFRDTNGDGIGDLPGVIEKLDYIQSLGCDAIWLNPCFDSPFLDAGYDIRDFYRVAERYGTNDDLARLFREAKRRGMRVLLDLVIGHTSIDHPWFLESCRHGRNRFTDWFIWTDNWYKAPQAKIGMGYLRGYGEREGTVATNFFWHQPKINFGFVEPDPKEAWQLPIDHPTVREVWEEMEKVVRFWLELGADGYRIDSAKSLVVGDPREGSALFYRKMRAMLDRDFPEAVLISEWGWPCDALRAGLHADFLLHNMKAYTSLLVPKDGENGYCTPVFDESGEGDVLEFLEHFLFHYDQTCGTGHIALPTSNHDCRRISTGRSQALMKTVHAFLMTMPGIPFIYYGEEIGMRHLDGLPSKEGGYPRTGSRTPMQWNAGPNAGFSAAPQERLYLPIDPDSERPTVEAQERDPHSLLNAVRSLAALRRRLPALRAGAAFRIVYANHRTFPFLYEREAEGQRVLVALNPSGRSVTAQFELEGADDYETTLATEGVGWHNDSNNVRLDMGPVSYAIFVRTPSR